MDNKSQLTDCHEVASPSLEGSVHVPSRGET